MISVALKEYQFLNSRKFFVNLNNVKDGKMDIQTRKIEFIQEFLKLQNEELISRLENLLRAGKSKNDDFKQMTIDEFNSRIDQSMNDSKNERLTNSNDLITEIEKWS